MGGKSQKLKVKEQIKEQKSKCPPRAGRLWRKKYKNLKTQMAKRKTKW